RVASEPDLDRGAKMRNPHLSARASAAAVIALVGCTVAQQPTTPPNTLVAAKVASAPNLAAGAADPAWAQAQPLKVALTGGANFGGKGETTSMLKAVYAGDMLYMLVQYADPTDSKRRGPYQKQVDGSWKKLADPQDKGGRRQRLLRGQVGDDLADRQLGEGLRDEGLRGDVPRWQRRQAVRQQVHAQRGRDRRHVAHEAIADGAVRVRRRPVHGPHALRREDESQRRPQE